LEGVGAAMRRKTCVLLFCRWAASGLEIESNM
jgi:hypothetical protein